MQSIALVARDERREWSLRPARVLRRLLREPLMPVLAVIFVVFFVVGMALPVIPLHVHEGLGLGTFVVGLVAGAQFAAALVSRLWAGACSDRRGPKPAVVTGLVLATVAGLFYLISLRFVSAPAMSVVILLLGRALLGGAESFIVTGALSWGLAVAGAQNTGKVMAWVGTAMYAAFAVAAPAGSALHAGLGFASIAWATALAPLVALLGMWFLRPAAPVSPARPAVRGVLKAVWRSGIGLALSCVGFGAITTFVSLHFSAQAWGSAWLAFSALSLAFVTGRLALGHLPDRMGGGRVALVSVLLEAAGLALIWLAPWSILAVLGAGLSGLGYSLVYPAFGVEAVRRAPAESRGLAMGVYSAFLDLSLGLTNPVLGWLAGWAGMGTVFAASAVVVLGSAVVALQLVCLERAEANTG